jgi:uncharacterized protein YbaP (TraB family)
VFSVTACTGSKQTAVADTRLENNLLWKVSHKRIKEESYLFGTIHFIDKESYFLPAGTQEAMERADRFVFEIDMREMTSIGAQLSLITKAFMKNGVRLNDLVSAEDYTLVEQHVSDAGMPMTILDRVKPMFLMMFTSMEFNPADVSSGEMLTYEMEIYEIAKDLDKETGGLETLDFQISMFDSIPYAVQAEMLMESIRAEEDQSDMFAQMVDLYTTQDIEALYEATGDEEMGVGEYEDLLLNNRNRRWIEGITAYMKEGSTFFAVGAGHLGGPHGVIRLLRKAGFTVTPVVVDADRPARKI